MASKETPPLAKLVLAATQESAELVNSAYVEGLIPVFADSGSSDSSIIKVADGIIIDEKTTSIRLKLNSDNLKGCDRIVVTTRDGTPFVSVFYIKGGVNFNREEGSIYNSDFASKVLKYEVFDASPTEEYKNSRLFSLKAKVGAYIDTDTSASLRAEIIEVDTSRVSRIGDILDFKANAADRVVYHEMPVDETSSFVLMAQGMPSTASVAFGDEEISELSPDVKRFIGAAISRQAQLGQKNIDGKLSTTILPQSTKLNLPPVAAGANPAQFGQLANPYDVDSIQLNFNDSADEPISQARMIIDDNRRVIDLVTLEGPNSEIEIASAYNSKCTPATVSSTNYDASTGLKLDPRNRNSKSLRPDSICGMDFDFTINFGVALPSNNDSVDHTSNGVVVKPGQSYPETIAGHVSQGFGKTMIGSDSVDHTGIVKLTRPWRHFPLSRKTKYVISVELIRSDDITSYAADGSWSVDDVSRIVGRNVYGIEVDINGVVSSTGDQHYSINNPSGDDGVSTAIADSIEANDPTSLYLHTAIPRSSEKSQIVGVSSGSSLNTVGGVCVSPGITMTSNSADVRLKGHVSAGIDNMPGTIDPMDGCGNAFQVRVQEVSKYPWDPSLDARRLEDSDWEAVSPAICDFRTTTGGSNAASSGAQALVSCVYASEKSFKTVQVILQIEDKDTAAGFLTAIPVGTRVQQFPYYVSTHTGVTGASQETTEPNAVGWVVEEAPAGTKTVKIAMISGAFVETDDSHSKVVGGQSVAIPAPWYSQVIFVTSDTTRKTVVAGYNITTQSTLSPYTAPKEELFKYWPTLGTGFGGISNNASRLCPGTALGYWGGAGESARSIFGASFTKVPTHGTEASKGKPEIAMGVLGFRQRGRVEIDVAPDVSVAAHNVYAQLGKSDSASGAVTLSDTATVMQDTKVDIRHDVMNYSDSWTVKCNLSREEVITELEEAGAPLWPVIPATAAPTLRQISGVTSRSKDQVIALRKANMLTSTTGSLDRGWGSTEVRLAVAANITVAGSVAVAGPVGGNGYAQLVIKGSPVEWFGYIGDSDDFPIGSDATTLATDYAGKSIVKLFGSYDFTIAGGSDPNYVTSSPLVGTDEIGFNIVVISGAVHNIVHTLRRKDATNNLFTTANGTTADAADAEYTFDREVDSTFASAHTSAMSAAKHATWGEQDWDTAEGRSRYSDQRDTATVASVGFGVPFTGGHQSLTAHNGLFENQVTLKPEITIEMIPANPNDIMPKFDVGVESRYGAPSLATHAITIKVASPGRFYNVPLAMKITTNIRVVDAAVNDDGGATGAMPYTDVWGVNMVVTSNKHVIVEVPSITEGTGLPASYNLSRAFPGVENLLLSPMATSNVDMCFPQGECYGERGAGYDPSDFTVREVVLTDAQSILVPKDNSIVGLSGHKYQHNAVSSKTCKTLDVTWNEPKTELYPIISAWSHDSTGVPICSGRDLSRPLDDTSTWRTGVKCDLFAKVESATMDASCAATVTNVKVMYTSLVAHTPKRGAKQGVLSFSGCVDGSATDERPTELTLQLHAKYVVSLTADQLITSSENEFLADYAPSLELIRPGLPAVARSEKALQLALKALHAPHSLVAQAAHKKGHEDDADAGLGSLFRGLASGIKGFVNKIPDGAIDTIGSVLGTGGDVVDSVLGGGAPQPPMQMQPQRAYAPQTQNAMRQMMSSRGMPERAIRERSQQAVQSGATQMQSGGGIGGVLNSLTSMLGGGSGIMGELAPIASGVGELASGIMPLLALAAPRDEAPWNSYASGTSTSATFPATYTTSSGTDTAGEFTFSYSRRPVMGVMYRSSINLDSGSGDNYPLYLDEKLKDGLGPGAIASIGHTLWQNDKSTPASSQTWYGTIYEKVAGTPILSQRNIIGNSHESAATRAASAHASNFMSTGTNEGITQIDGDTYAMVGQVGHVALKAETFPGLAVPYANAGDTTSGKATSLIPLS